MRYIYNKPTNCVEVKLSFTDIVKILFGKNIYIHTNPGVRPKWKYPLIILRKRKK